jgi:D-arabinose 1-dehydrogenase-like Zn-dependent alcohol dehydrogenase
MGYKVVGVDISDDVLEATKSAGADAVFNSRMNPNYIDEIKEITCKGVHAAAVFSAADAAYASAIELLRTGGLLMVIGIAKNPLPVSTFDLTTGRYRIKADSTGIPQRMKKAVDFISEHGILPEVEYRKLDDLPQMAENMHAGKAKYRQVVLF